MGHKAVAIRKYGETGNLDIVVLAWLGFHNINVLSLGGGRGCVII